MIRYRPEMSLLLIIAPATSLVTGCATVGIREVRDLPGRTISAELENAWYDPSVLAYRLPDNKVNPKEGNKVIRDASGKKIRTEEELDRFIKANESEDFSTGKMVAGLVGGIVFSPIYVVESIVSLPFLPVFGNICKGLQNDAEEAYASGLEAFKRGEFDTALTEFERSRPAMPVMSAHSDIDYLRGQAFEAAGKVEESVIAFLKFINYSERTVPEWFEKEYADSASWLEKARDAQTRIDTLRLSRQSP